MTFKAGWYKATETNNSFKKSRGNWYWFDIQGEPSGDRFVPDSKEDSLAHNQTYYYVGYELSDDVGGRFEYDAFNVNQLTWRFKDFVKNINEQQGSDVVEPEVSDPIKPAGKTKVDLGPLNWEAPGTLNHPVVEKAKEEITKQIQRNLTAWPYGQVLEFQLSADELTAYWKWE